VPGLDEFLHNGRLFTIGIFLTNYKSSPHFVPLVFVSIHFVLFLTKIWLVTFWSILSQTHPVTLVSMRQTRERSNAIKTAPGKLAAAGSIFGKDKNVGRQIVVGIVTFKGFFRVARFFLVQFTKTGGNIPH
jgi:hypothetical protein